MELNIEEVGQKLEAIGLKRNSQSYADYEYAKKILLPENDGRIDYCIIIQAICDYLDL